MKKTPITGRQPAMPLLDFLAHCAHTAALAGDWVSAKDAKARNVDPSADLAYEAALGGGNVNADDWQVAAKAVELFEARVASAKASQFDVDLRQQMVDSGRTVHGKNYRMMAAMMGLYQRTVKQAASVPSLLPSFHLGRVGERIVVTATVTHISAYRGAYSSRIINFVTPEGARLTWFCNADDWDVGKTYTFKATIKSHREFQGQPQTMVNRCAAVAEAIAG